MVPLFVWIFFLPRLYLLQQILLLISFPSWITESYSTTLKLTLQLIQDTIWKHFQYKSKKKYNHNYFCSFIRVFLWVYLSNFNIFFIYWLLNYSKIKLLKLLLISVGKQCATPRIIHISACFCLLFQNFIQLDCRGSLNGNVENILVPKYSSWNLII